MKKIFSYNDGQVAVIADYSLFQNPTPTEWNEDVYGYGVEWKPGATKVMHDSFELYAQYQPIYINYYLTCYNLDGKESVQLVSYANRVGTRIEVADFPGIEGFKCWHDADGNIVSVGSYMYMTQTSSLFMSCDFEYELKFDGNGAKGHMDPLSATKHVYIDHSSKNIFVEDAKVMLPESTFSNDGLFSRSWHIDGNVRGFNELYTLTASTTAYALWQDPTLYTLDLGCQLVNEDYAFQYFMLKIDEFVGQSQKIGRFSKICFIDGLGQEMLFPDNATASSINVDDFGSTDLVDALDGSTETTIAFSTSKLPCALVFDLKSQAFDISRYSRMQIWTSTDQTSFKVNCFRAFQLYVSNNGQNWYLADSYDGDTSYEDASIMYESQTMYVASEEIELDFDGGDVPSTPSSEYTLMDYAKGNGGYINLNYIPTQMTKLQFKMRTSSFTGNVFIGFRDSTDRKDFRFFATNSSNVYFDLSDSRWHLCKANAMQSNRWYDVECSYSGMKIDSVQASCEQESTRISQIESLPICVFGEASSPIQFDLKHLKIYEISNSINIKARYLQFKIQNYGDEFTQFSELAFFNSSGSQFAFPLATTYECSITAFGSSMENPERAIDGLTWTKACIRSSSNNFTLTYDLKYDALNLSIYNIFKIYAGYDNVLFQNRSVRNIEIYAKESGQSQFTLIHSASNIPKQIANQAVGYSVTLTSGGIDNLKKDIRPAKDNQGRSCLVDVLTGDKFYSANSTDIVCTN